MKTTIATALLLLFAVWTAASGQKADDKKQPDKNEPARAEPDKKEPFYRRYLTPGNPLDDKIKAQEARVEADPDSAALRNDFGNLLALRRFPKEAREQYEIAMKLDKHGYLAPYNMGLVYETEGKISQAIRSYEKSIDRNRGFPPSLFRLGRLYEKRGRETQAIEAYGKALRIDPEMRDPRHNPLVVDTRLLDRVSLAIYDRDLAAASVSSDSRYADEARFRPIPYDRPIASEEVEPYPPAPPGSPAPTPVRRAPQALPAAPGQTRPQAVAPAPAPAAGTLVPAPAAPGSSLPRGAPVFETPRAPLITPIPPPPTPEG